MPKGPYPPPPTGVNSDVPLAEHGVKQAKELAHYIMSIENQPELIFSSPFFRCLQTSEPISDLLELPIYLERGIGEWYKPDRDVIPEPASFDILNNFFPGKLNRNWTSSVIPSNKGETEQDIFERCRTFWPIFIKNVEETFPNVETILIVTHAATKIALGMNLLGFDNCRDPIDDEGSIIRSGSCSLDKYELVHNDEDDDIDAEELPFEERHWRITMNGNTEFLTKGEEMHWDFKYGFEAGSDADIKARQAAAASSGAAANKTLPSESQNSTEYEHVYVSVDIPNSNYREKNEIEPTATLQYSGLETETPLLKVGDKLYEGSWKKLVGTELAFPNAATVKKRAQEKDNQNESVDENDHEEEVQEGERDGAIQEKIYRITDRLVLNDVHRM